MDHRPSNGLYQSLHNYYINTILQFKMNHHGNLDVAYLQKQNRKLRLELKEATALGQLHKAALIKLSEKVGDSHQVVRTLTEILRSSKEEAVKQRLRDQVFTLEGQILVLEKIVNQTYENERETYLLLVEEFKKLQEENTKMELQLHKFYEKIGEVDYLSGLVTKYKEIVTPAEFAISSKKEQDQLLDMLNLQREQIRKLTQEKEKLLRINVHMKEEVERKKDEVKNMTMMILNDDRNYENPTGNNTMILAELDQDNDKVGQSMIQMRNNMSNLNISQSNNLNTTLNFVKLQRQLIKEVDEENFNDDSEDSDQFDCPELSILFPDKVQQIRANKQQAKVPYLNMKKVRELMAKRQQKMRKEIQAEGHHVNPTNKIIQLETQLDITRKELTSQMLKFRIMLDDNKRMVLHIQELEQRNQILAKSNETLTVNYRNIYKDYQICKSITNQVEKLLGRKISNDKSVLNAREELSTLMLANQQGEKQDEDRLNKLVNNIFKDNRPFQHQRSLSP